MKEERRRYPRYTFHRIVSYKRRGKQFLTLTLDLAIGGMKIKTDRPLPKDDRLSFKLVLGDHCIWLKGRIAHSGSLPDKQRVSDVQFVDLSREDYAILQRYLSTMEEWPNRGRYFPSMREVAPV